MTEDARLLQLAADAVPGGLYRLHAESRAAAYLSRGFAELTGYDGEAVRVRLGGDGRGMVHPEDREIMLRDLAEQIGLHPDHQYDLEYRIRCADGAVLHVNDRGARVIDPETDQVYDCGLLMNISDTYAAEQRLRAAQQELVEANRAKNDFLAHMSHEIRTPIHAVSGLTDLMLLSGVLNSDMYAHASGIKSAAQTLLYLVNDILDFSKIAAGRMPIIPAPFSVRGLLHDLCTQVGMRVRGKQLTLLADVDPDLPSVLIGDELRIKQVLLNLLTNAAKFTQAGSVTLRMAGEPDGAGGYTLHYAVADTGVGIRPEDMEGLYEQFRQLDPAADRKQEGSGLGLAISRQLVRLMGGDIAVESQYGHGSCFAFSLKHAVEDPAPVAGVHDAAHKRLLVCAQDAVFARHVLAQAARLGVEGKPVQDFSTGERCTHVLVEGDHSAARTWLGAALPAGTHRAAMLRGDATQVLPEGTRGLSAPLHAPLLADWLNDAVAAAEEETVRDEQLAQCIFATQGACALIVDDNPANLLVGSSLLKLFGLSVREAGSGQQALDMVDQQPYDIVLMDHMMPGMTGEETVRALRERAELDALPIVVLTANLPAETNEIYQGVHIQGVLTKPLELRKLSATLLRLLPPHKILPDSVEERGEHPALEARALLSGVPELDYGQGLFHCAEDESLYLSLLFAVVQDFADKRALLEAAASQGELSNLALCAHSLKSVLRSIGCAALGEEAFAIERHAKAGEVELLAERLPPFLREMEGFRLALQGALRRLPRETQMAFFEQE